MKRLACFSAVAMLAAACTGCDKTEEKSDENKKPAGARGSFLAPGSIEDLANAGGKGKGNPSRPAANGRQNQAQPQQPAPQFHERRVAGKAKNFGVLTDRVVNYDVEIRKNPKLKIVDNRNGGGGYLSTLGGAYFSSMTKLSKALFEKELRLRAELNGGRYPTYQQYITAKKQMRVELVKLPEYQMYAYQEKNGKLVVLEDPDLKAKIQGK